MIQIDDSGSGSLIGGTGIGLLDTTNNNYYFEIIPLIYYQTDLYNKKLYQDYVIDIVKRGFKKLNVTKREHIQICQGYMFDKLRKWLSENNYNFISTKIEAPLQYKVEESFNEYVIGLGLPKDFIKHARFAFGFHRLFKWVQADLDNRKKLCKTQWKSWQKWENIEKSIYRNQLTYQDYCLKCGQKLKPPLNVITIEYITNKPATINLHEKCYKGDLNEIPPLFIRNFTTKIRVSKKGVDNVNLNYNDELFLKIIATQLKIISKNDELIGDFNTRLGKKLSFWINKGFKWKFFFKDYFHNYIKIQGILDK